MKVLFIGPRLGRGGAERHTSILVPGLRDRGIDARVIALAGGGQLVEALQRNGVPVDVIGMRHQADLTRLWRSKLVRDFEPDIVISRGGVSGQYVGGGVATWRRATHIYNDHGGIGLTITLRREAMTRIVARALDYVVGVASNQAVAWSARGYPPERFVVIPNGVDVPVVHESREEIRRELGIAESRIVAVSVANLRPEKQLPLFVQALRAARLSQPALIGLIVGAGPERSAIALAAEGDPAIQLLGLRDDVPRLLKAADIFVLTSRYEAAPMSILEAMAAGLPILGTRVGGIPDVIVHGESGLLVSPGDLDAIADGLTRLAASRELRARMGVNAERLYRVHWTAGAMVDAYARFLESVWLPPEASSESSSVPATANRKL